MLVLLTQLFKIVILSFLTSLDPKLKVGKSREQTLSEDALKSKGLWNYLKTLPEPKLHSRLMYGFLKKRGKGKMKSFQLRWFFLFSSRPLN